MAITQLIKSQENGGQEEQQQQRRQALSNAGYPLLCALPKERGWRTPNLFLYQGFWCQEKEIQAIMSAQRHFEAQAGDVILASIPKSGTTWLKALVFAIVNRGRFGMNTNHPLLTRNPHELVPFLEYKLYADNNTPDLSSFPRPRLFATHVPIKALPESIKKSACKIVYICRNPFDTFVSAWHFLNKIRPDDVGPFFSLEEAFDMYCKGVIGFGPYWDHMLGYWNSSLGTPDEVMFLKYEEMKEDTNFHVARLAGFLGCPFSPEEVREGIVDGISRLCSFENLKEMEVNKKGKGAIANFENKSLFRKAEVGDWVNHLTPLMVERLANIMDEKIGSSGLSFKVL